MIGEIAGILTAIVGLLALIGGGIKWLWSVIERRFTNIENELKKCRSREDRGDERRARMWTVIEILIEAVERLDPDDRLLRRAKDMVTTIKAQDARDVVQHALEPAE
jgi:putative protein kinase ArgK-like GTPase of G3E family